MKLPSLATFALLLAIAMGRAQQLEDLDLLAETSPDYVLTRWGMEDGLPSDRVRAVLQTRDGFVWAATFNGLARFDGVNFRVFNDENVPAMKNRLINRLHEDRQGRLWIGCDTGDLLWRDPAGFHAVAITNTWRISPIVRMVDLADGVLFALNRDGQLLRVTNGVAGAPTSEPLYSDLLADPQNQVWAVRRGGAMRRLTAEGEALESAGPPPESGYRNAAAARRGGFWVRDGLRLRRWQEGKWVEDRGVHAWGSRRSVVLQEISTGDVLVGTVDQGLFIVDGDGRERRLTRANGLAHNWIESLWEDREKSVWLGENGGGLQLLRPRVLAMVMPADRWQNQPVQSVTPAAGGGVWVGTLGAGVYRFDGQRFQHLADVSGQRGQYVRSVFEDRQQRLWIGTESGLYWWKDGQCGNPVVPATFPNLIYGLCEAKDDSIWVATQNGAIRFEKAVYERLGMNLVQADVRCIVQASDGAMWLGMRGGGVARFLNGQFTQFGRAQGLPYEYVWALCADADGSVWIGTSGGGLARYRDGVFFNFTTRHGLPSAFICAIETDHLGNLWVASYGGVFRVDKGDLDRCARGEIPTVNCLTLDSSEGLASLELAGGNQPAACRTDDGRFWFATSRGLAVVDPERIKIVRVPPPVVLEEILADGVAVEAWPGKPDAEVVVPPGSGQIEFKYAALSYGAPKRVHFKYQMAGLEEAWVDAGNRRSAFYSHLPPGSYRFRVIACSHFGYWSEGGAEVALKILPYFWQTWWFEPLCWLGGATVVGAGIVNRLRRRHRGRLETLERARLLDRERARIAHDLHDDLGTGLTEIHTTSALGLDPGVPPQEANEYFHEISQRARELVMSLDEIVWAVNPKNDNLGSLATYFCLFTEQFLRPAKVSCRFDVADDLPAVPLDSDRRHSLFLALKEALNNAVRHAQATHVTLAISIASGEMRVAVTDDGCGFDPGMQRADADGLENMRARLEALGGRCEIVSRPGTGTKVNFVLPMAG